MRRECEQINSNIVQNGAVQCNECLCGETYNVYLVEALTERLLLLH